MTTTSRLAERTRRLAQRGRPFRGSAKYWERRYRGGGTSGDGSYGANAEAKASVINELVTTHGITSVVELGCGDGSQLAKLRVPRYVGLDVSATAVRMCGEQFSQDSSKSFFRYDPDSFYDRADVLSADLAMSLEVIFHLVEDHAFESYMTLLFSLAQRYVLILSTNADDHPEKHVRHRAFTAWVETHAPDWDLKATLPNPRPYRPETGEGMLSDFYLYEHRTS